MKNVSTIIQSTIIIILIAIVATMLVYINQLQGTARVINYAGLVRGATQRGIKLEISKNPNDALIERLDDILSGLKYEKGSYKLSSLKDKNYQDNLDVQLEYWEDLKKEIARVRSSGYENTNIINMSEAYFELADNTVSAAEVYSEKIAQNIRMLEIASAIDMMLLIVIIVQKTIVAIKITRKNKQLKKTAYLDVHTGLPNKSCCEKFFQENHFINEPMAIIVYDLNNLKIVNDTLGHMVGDQFICNFSNIIRNTIPAKDFVGRYGGDEFMAVINNASKEDINKINAEVENEVKRFNELNHGGKHFDISYAYGCAFSDDYKHCTFKTLFNRADKNMYQNKICSKNQLKNDEWEK